MWCVVVVVVLSSVIYFLVSLHCCDARDCSEPIAAQFESDVWEQYFKGSKKGQKNRKKKRRSKQKKSQTVGGADVSVWGLPRGISFCCSAIF